MMLDVYIMCASLCVSCIYTMSYHTLKFTQTDTIDIHIHMHAYAHTHTQDSIHTSSSLWSTLSQLSLCFTTFGGSSAPRTCTQTHTHTHTHTQFCRAVNKFICHQLSLTGLLSVVSVELLTDFILPGLESLKRDVEQVAQDKLVRSVLKM